VKVIKVQKELLKDKKQKSRKPSSLKTDPSVSRQTLLFKVRNKSF